MTKLEDNELYRRIDEVLFYLWDPIGVSDMDTPEARDEYYNYLPRVYQAVVRGDTQKQVTDLLASIEKQSMEQEPKLERCKEIAELLIDWSRYLRDKR